VCALGLWWVIVGLILRKWTVLAHAVFRPFADECGQRWAVRLAVVGVVVVALCVAAGVCAPFLM